MSTSDSVTAIITYSLPPADGSRAFQRVAVDPITGEREKNILQEPYEVVVENVRGKEDLYTLDNSGFQFHNRPTKVKDFQNEKIIQEVYYPESTEIIKELTGASRVVLFDHSTCLKFVLVPHH